jgi:hypothetical protein
MSDSGIKPTDPLANNYKATYAQKEYERKSKFQCSKFNCHLAVVLLLKKTILALQFLFRDHLRI